MPDKHLKTARLLAQRSLQHGDYSGAVEICACAIRLATAADAIDGGAKDQLGGVLRSAVAGDDKKAAAAALIEALTAQTGTDVEVDADGPSEARALVLFYTSAAISMGAPAYNQRDHAGCYEVYAATARMLIETGKLPAETVERLRQGLAEASIASTSDKAAWAMRHALDDIRAVRPAGVAERLTDRPQARSEPRAGVASMKDMVRAAISIGAPIYDAGDARGCFEVYATVARFLLRMSSPAPSAARGHLKQALEECALMTSASDQAWALRKALDRVLLERELEVLTTAARAPLRTRSALVRALARTRRHTHPSPTRKHRQRR